MAKQKYNFEEFCNIVVKLETKMIDYPRFEETYEKHLWDVCDTAVEISNKFYKKNVAKLSDCERILKFNELLNIFIKTFVPFYEL